MPRNGDVLQVGEKIRLTPGGPVFEVYRVSACAAYIRSTNMVLVVIPDPTDPEAPGKKFYAAEGKVKPISRRSHVYREESE